MTPPRTDVRVAVTSRSFSRNAVLRGELLGRYGNVTFNDAGESLDSDRLVEFLAGHDKAIVALERITGDVIARLPQLKVISKYGVGVDMIDLEALNRHGVRLGWRPGVNRRSVAELVIALTIGMLRHLPAANREVQSGVWRQHIGATLTGKTVAIIGLGHVGKDLATILKGFDCRIVAHDILHFPEFCAQHGVTQVGLEEAIASGDVVTIHVPHDRTTHGMFSAERLDLLKPAAILVNTARGGIVDEDALKDRLKDGRLAGAAFDVFASEPPADSELISLPNFFATPHLGGSAAEAVLAMGWAAIDGLDEPAPTFERR